MNTKRLPLALLIAATMSPAFAFDAETARQINAANSFVREGKYDEAISGYQSVTAALGETNYELDYNLGVAEYRKGELATAKGLFKQAASSAEATLASAARYNLGNCFYSDAVAAAENDKPAAIEALTQAIEHYRGSLVGDPNHVDARANIELANELLKKLREEQDQQQDQQQQDSQSPQDESQQNEEKSQESQSKEGESKQESKQQGTEANENESKQEDSQQDSEEQRHQDAEAKPEASSGNSADSGSQASPQNVEGSPPAASDEDQSQDENQSIPSGELTSTAEQDSSEQSRGRVGIDDGKVENAPMSKEEALKLLQSVRDRDMLRRLRAEQIERKTHVPTDRDW